LGVLARVFLNDNLKNKKNDPHPLRQKCFPRDRPPPPFYSFAPSLTSFFLSGAVGARLRDLGFG
jgi:hypothetical protein